MKRILCSLLVATLPFGSVLADAPKSKNAKVTLVYQHELPNVPGKSIKGVLVEYDPGGYSPGHTHPKSAFIYATVLEGEQRQCQQDEADQAPRGVRGGHERDGTDDPIRELTPGASTSCVATSGTRRSTVSLSARRRGSYNANWLSSRAAVPRDSQHNSRSRIQSQAAS